MNLREFRIDYRSFMALFFVLMAIEGCNPKDVPNAPNFNEPPIGTPKKSQNNEKETSKRNPIGLPRQQQEARHQAGEVGPHAALPIKKEQLQFGTSAGETKGKPPPFADAAGEVFEEPNGPMSIRKLPSSKQQEDIGPKQKPTQESKSGS